VCAGAPTHAVFSHSYAVSDMAKSIHGRYPWNAFCGKSTSAYETNYRHHLLYALHLYQRQRDRTRQLLVASMENPKASRAFHPLTRVIPPPQPSPRTLPSLPCQHTRALTKAFPLAGREHRSCSQRVAEVPEARGGLGMAKVL
jgi:hypothetical protein